MSQPLFSIEMISKKKQPLFLDVFRISTSWGSLSDRRSLVSTGR
jgi:hypothetical protein